MSSDERTIGGNGGRFGDKRELSNGQKTPIAILDPAREKSWQSNSEAAQSDPRVAAALEEYPDALNSGFTAISGGISGSTPDYCRGPD
jgi:hypothetical protein